MLPMPLAACRPLKCGYWDRGTESLILFNFKSCELATHGEYNCREIDLTGVDRIHWKEKQKTRSPVRLLFQSWCRVGTEAGNVERKTDEKWGRRESKIILWLATSLSSQSLLHLLFLPSRPSLSVRFPQSLSQLSFLTCSSHIPLVSVTSSVLTSLKFILAVLDCSSLPLIPDISTRKSHKLVVFPYYSYFCFSFLNLGKYNCHPLSCSSWSPENFLDTLFVTCWCSV